MLPDDPSSIPPDSETPDPEPPATDRAERGEAASPRSESSLRCPVCRARQPLQPTCRRCKADLRLLVAALREVARLQACHAQALAQGDEKNATQITKQLKQLQG